MKSNTRILKFVAIAALAAGSVPAASAAGLLGQRYAAATFDWALWDNGDVDGGKIEDGHGITLALNQPLAENVDLALSYSYLDAGGRVDLGEGDVAEFDISAQSLLFGGTFYMPVGTVKPFIAANLGWARTRAAGNTDNDAVYQIVPGVEIPAGDRASLTLFAAWNDYFDNEVEDDGSLNFGALAEFEVSSKWSVLARTSIDDDSNWGISVGALVRF